MTVVTVLCQIVAHAEVYTWTDADGRKNFGDKIPEGYAKDAVTVDISIHQPSQEDLEKAQLRLENSRAAYQKEKNKKVRKPRQKKAPKNQQAKELTYEQHVAAYEESKRCYAVCQVRFIGPSTQHYNPRSHSMETSPGASGVNNAYCGHCTPVPKPSIRR